MKILVVCQYYYPEPFRVNDICEELVQRGHDVTVVTGTPNYPEGEIYQGYENHQRADEIINGVTVHRCPIIPRKKGVLYRFLNYYSFPLQAGQYVKRLKASGEKSFDVILVNQLSPVMMAQPAIIYKKRNKTPMLLYCLDLWPESLVAGGISRKSLIFRFFHEISRRIYRQADKILVTSRLFTDYLFEEFGINKENMGYLPQYAEGLFQELIPREADGVINLLFAGNIGEIQSVDTVVRAAEKLQDKPVHFHIVGGGTNLERLQSMGENLANVTFYGRRPLEEMPAFYAKADAMLVTLKGDPVLSLTLPGKVQSYMAAGKPIIGAINGETAHVIREAQCGYCGPADDADELVKNIIGFMKSEDKVQLGRNARAFYDEYFTRKQFMDKLENELKNL